ncbi:hypothetical protein HRR81_001634, partial [Exophiala dermatitidis]
MQAGNQRPSSTPSMARQLRLYWKVTCGLQQVLYQVWPTSQCPWAGTMGRSSQISVSGPDSAYRHVRMPETAPLSKYTTMPALSVLAVAHMSESKQHQKHKMHYWNIAAFSPGYAAMTSDRRRTVDQSRDVCAERIHQESDIVCFKHHNAIFLSNSLLQTDRQ